MTGTSWPDVGTSDRDRLLDLVGLADVIALEPLGQSELREQLGAGESDVARDRRPPLTDAAMVLEPSHLAPVPDHERHDVVSTQNRSGNGNIETPHRVGHQLGHVIALERIDGAPAYLARSRRPAVWRRHQPTPIAHVEIVGRLPVVVADGCEFYLGGAVASLRSRSLSPTCGSPVRETFARDRATPSRAPHGRTSQGSEVAVAPAVPWGPRGHCSGSPPASTPSNPRYASLRGFALIEKRSDGAGGQRAQRGGPGAHDGIVDATSTSPSMSPRPRTRTALASAHRSTHRSPRHASSGHGHPTPPTSSFQPRPDSSRTWGQPEVAPLARQTPARSVRPSHTTGQPQAQPAVGSRTASRPTPLDTHLSIVASTPIGHADRARRAGCTDAREAVHHVTLLLLLLILTNDRACGGAPCAGASGPGSRRGRLV
jgi:hypothetical protein